MKFTVILLLTFFSLSAMVAQSKRETEEWILEKYNNYKKVNEFSSQNDLRFENGEVKVKIVGTDYNFSIKKIIKVQIKQERWNNDDKEGWTSIYLYYDKDEVIEITLSSELILEGYKNKMEKALIQLVKLYGGNATIKKEAF